MILIEATLKYAGYDPRELKPNSHKRVCCVCDVCGRVRWARFNSCGDLCLPCSTRTDEHRRKVSEALTGVPLTAEHRKNIGDGNRGKTVSDETRAKISKTNKGKKKPPLTDEHRCNISKAMKGKKKPPRTKEFRQRLSAYQQGIPYEEWTGFTKNGEYCELFDDACRERIRAKYGHRCYICDKPQEENVEKTGNVRKLSVHHVDRNRNQGCDGVQWKLVPLCASCHTGSHYDPVKSRLEYLLDDEDV